MNWNCIVCGDDFGVNPVPTKSLGYGTFNDGQDVQFVCPKHTDELKDHIAKLKAECDVNRDANHPQHLADSISNSLVSTD